MPCYSFLRTLLAEALSVCSLSLILSEEFAFLSLANVQEKNSKEAEQPGRAWDAVTSSSAFWAARR